MSERILIADDSLSVREAAQAALKPRGAQVDLVADGNQAMARLRGNAPDLLIADVHMPGLDGYALCREVKGERPTTRVLLLVGTFEAFDSGAATSARADGVLRKPFLPDELIRRVEDLLGRPPAPEPPRKEAPRAAEPTPVAPVLAEPKAEPAPEPAPATTDGAAALSDAAVDRIARRVLELGGEAVLERVARELLGVAVTERVRLGAARVGDRGGDPERG